jgi:tRNA U54 and U55 pseudouridine synthase Pus10
MGKTKSRRGRKKRIAVAAAAIANGRSFGPNTNCYVCGHRLHDFRSIALGIGFWCWQKVMEERMKLKNLE